MKGPPSLEVLCEGWLVREGGEVVDASSTVALLLTDIGPVLIDTGSRARAPDLAAALSRSGVGPGDVRHVVNTHLHTDHCGCNDMFPDAVFHAHALEDPPAGCRRVAREEQVAGGVRLVPTPGHTRGSVSVFVEADRRYAVCGDALPTKANYESNAPPAVHFDRALALRSMEAVLAWADTVVPGHDRPFDVVRKK
ncbi:MAG: MBL fold metallo-hydrolase [Candidatus Thermoplasmatota archaeon]